MLLKFFKNWGFYIACGFTVFVIFLFLIPHFLMGDDAIKRAHLSDIAVFVAVKKNEVIELLIENDPINSFEEEPNWNHVKYFHRSSDGSMYIQTDERAYFLIPFKKDDDITWICRSSDGSIAPFGCIDVGSSTSQNT